jgi:hypothetical protein
VNVGENGASASYYGRPVIKPPVWKPEIPWYFWTGGIAGASAVLGQWARLSGNEHLATTASRTGAVFDAVSPLLLISDLGRPERFLNMLRVFKVTSPMSVGSWILLANSGASTTGVVLGAIGRLPRLKRAAEAVSAATGAPLATYTAALVANTAVPVWHEGRRELPFVFAGSAAASAGAAAAMLAPPSSAGPARRLAVSGAAAANVAAAVMERRLGFVGEPYRVGSAGRFARLARTASTMGAALLGTAGARSRPAAVAGAALVLGGELARRWSVFRAGFQSAEDPRYTVVPQRERLTAS